SKPPARSRRISRSPPRPGPLVGEPPAGLLLAAGAGRRFGGPKALALLDGEPLVLRALRTLEAAGCEPVRVVVGAAAPEVTALLPDPAAPTCAWWNAATWAAAATSTTAPTCRESTYDQCRDRLARSTGRRPRRDGLPRRRRAGHRRVPRSADGPPAVLRGRAGHRQDVP